MPGESSCDPSRVFWQAVGGPDQTISWKCMYVSTQNALPRPKASQMLFFCINLLCHVSNHAHDKFRKNRHTRYEIRIKMVSIFFSGHPVHVHIHITSKNGNVCKLCATERIFRLTWPQLWRHRSNVRGSGSWNFQGGRKKGGRKAIEKMVTIERLTKMIFQKNRRGGGGCINPPPPCACEGYAFWMKDFHR